MYANIPVSTRLKLIWFRDRKNRTKIIRLIEIDFKADTILPITILVIFKYDFDTMCMYTFLDNARTVI